MNDKMRMKSLQVLVFLFAVNGVAPLVMQAQQTPGPHPAYLRALSDLRAARFFLQEEGDQPRLVRKAEKEAIREINAAIDQIKEAALEDGKDLSVHPPIDTRLSAHDRFRQANQLLWRAHLDLMRREVMISSRDHRNSAVMHIDAAHHIVDQAAKTEHW
jgi:hypothetical protein